MRSPPIDHAYVCSPVSTEHFRKNGSCLTFSDLKNIAHDYNNTNPHNKIPVSAFSSFHDLFQTLSHVFGPACASRKDLCWAKQKFVQDRAALLQKFRPPMQSSWKKHRTTPLLTTDILKGLKPYEDKFSDFALLGVFAIDFLHKNPDGSCHVYDQICNMNLPAFMRNGVRQFGMVINLDPHYRGGSHWIAVYMNTDPKDPRFGFYHFCSEASKPPQQILHYYENMRSQYASAFPKRKKELPFSSNNVRYQYKNSECGMYSLLFIILCLENPHQSVEKTLQSKLFPKSDDFVNSLRQVIFRSI